MSLEKTFKVIAVVLATLLVAAAAIYYLDLGWFNDRGKLVLSVLLLFTCIFLAIVLRNDDRTRR
jgi:hypothetical protein